MRTSNQKEANHCDVALFWVAPQGFVLAGTERVALTNGRVLELSQAWWARTL